jgi:hypothetical protein
VHYVRKAEKKVKPVAKKEKKEKIAPKSVEPFLGFYNAALCIHGIEGNICDECFTKCQEEEAEKKKEATTPEKHEYYVIHSSRNTPTLPSIYVTIRKTQEEALRFIRDNCFMASFRLIKMTSDSPITMEYLVIEQDPRVSRVQTLTQ